VTTSTLAQVHREPIIALAARHRLPAVYPFRFFSTSGAKALGLTIPETLLATADEVIQ
jgi:hypothetical protein